jgi:hypothetical protein
VQQGRLELPVQPGQPGQLVLKDLPVLRASRVLREILELLEQPVLLAHKESRVSRAYRENLALKVRKV